MPGVADQIRRTNLRQEQKRRKEDINEIVKMVQEGRLHEADERQLETLRLVAELQKVFAPDQQEVAAPAVNVQVDNTELIEAVKQAILEGVSNLPVGVGVSPAADPARPKMGHVSLTDLVQGDSDVKISHSDDLGEEKTGADDSADKLDKLRRLKKGSQ